MFLVQAFVFLKLCDISEINLELVECRSFFFKMIKLKYLVSLFPNRLWINQFEVGCLFPNNCFFQFFCGLFYLVKVLSRYPLFLDLREGYVTTLTLPNALIDCSETLSHLICIPAINLSFVWLRASKYARQSVCDRVSVRYYFLRESLCHHISFHLKSFVFNYNFGKNLAYILATFNT